MNTSRRIIKEVSDAIAGIHDQRDRLAQQVGLLQAKIRSLYAEYEGEGIKPAAGCDYATMFAGDTEVKVEYSFEPGEDAIYDLNSPMCGPGCGPACYIGAALVNGEWVNPDDVFAPSLIERWQEKIIEDRQQSDREALEDFYAERARDGSRDE
jgi:hypothetical protein